MNAQRDRSLCPWRYYVLERDVLLRMLDEQADKLYGTQPMGERKARAVGVLVEGAQAADSSCAPGCVDLLDALEAIAELLKR